VSPPLIVTEQEIERIAETFAAALDAIAGR
jgi:adenosylmethionine-8-amino-7-oxononanoate aminotransferase